MKQRGRGLSADRFDFISRSCRRQRKPACYRLGSVWGISFHDVDCFNITFDIKAHASYIYMCIYLYIYVCTFTYKISRLNRNARGTLVISSEAPINCASWFRIHGRYRDKWRGMHVTIRSRKTESSSLLRVHSRVKRRPLGWIESSLIATLRLVPYQLLR